MNERDLFSHLNTMAALYVSMAKREAMDLARIGKMPNILLILVDDTGDSDLNCYGSEIPTQRIHRLAFNGIVPNFIMKK